jgi:uncharacterized protein (UPF0332 family)
MNFDWKEFLNLARELHTTSKIKSNQEAVQRTVISRAYYAAHHYSYIYAEETDYQRQDGGKNHRGVIHHIGIHSPETSTLLNNLFDIRGDADYEDTLEEPYRQAEIALSFAEKIIGNIDKLRKYDE